MGTHPMLFVDGRNCLYRAVYANVPHEARAQGKATQRDDKHCLVVMLRFIKSWIEKHRPSSVHVFWDAPRHEVWRRHILPTYKDRADSDGLHAEAAALVNATQPIVVEVLTNLGVRHYVRKNMEADDLIYAACRVVYPHRVVVISSDGDFTQIPYFMANVTVYEPRHNVSVPVPSHNPVTAKALMGCVSDHIDGYDGIGPVKSAALAESVDVDGGVRLQKFLEQRGRRTFIQNQLLVDLALCPDLLANQLCVMRVLATQPVFNSEAVVAVASRYRLFGLVEELSGLVMAFKDPGKTNCDRPHLALRPHVESWLL